MKLIVTLIFLFVAALYLGLFIVAVNDIKRTIKGIKRSQPLPYRVGQWLGVWFVIILIIMMGVFIVLFGRAVFSLLF